MLGIAEYDLAVTLCATTQLRTYHSIHVYYLDIGEARSSLLQPLVNLSLARVVDYRFTTGCRA